MSLHLNLKVNGNPIDHTLSIRRVYPTGDPTPDQLCEYVWHMETKGSKRSGRVNHTFRRGAWALVATVLDDAGVTP